MKFFNKRVFSLLLFVWNSLIFLSFDACAYGEGNSPVFQIQRVYLKEISLVQPNSPSIFLLNENPTIEVTVDVASKKLRDGIYEVEVSNVVTAKIRDQIAFVVKAKQAGIFEIRNLTAQKFDEVLGDGSANLIYPYLRANLADIISRSGFPPIHMTVIDFNKFYKQRKLALIKTNG